MVILAPCLKKASAMPHAMLERSATPRTTTVFPSRPNPELLDAALAMAFLPPGAFRAGLLHRELRSRNGGEALHPVVHQTVLAHHLGPVLQPVRRGPHRHGRDDEPRAMRRGP